MEEIDQIQDLVVKINNRDSELKEYEKMKIEELSTELRNTIKFQQEVFQKIEEFESVGIQQDLTKYAKMICSNSTEREISKIQEAYLKKIETEYLKK